MSTTLARRDSAAPAVRTPVQVVMDRAQEILPLLPAGVSVDKAASIFSVLAFRTPDLMKCVE